MKIRHFGLIFGTMIIACCGASAQQLGVNFTGGGTNSDNFDYSLGYEFQVTSPVTLVGLAAYNFDDAALTQDVPVGLWTDSGTLLASATISAGTLPSGGSMFSEVSIAPITLSDGFYDVAAVDPYAWGGDGYASFTGVTIAPGISFVEDRYSEGPFAYPTISEYGETGGSLLGWFGGNVVVEGGTSVPDETSTLMLLGIVVVTIAAFRRKFAFSE